MTKEEKAEKRRVKKALVAAVLKHHFRDWKLRATNAQLKAGARKVAEQILSGKTPGTMVELK